MKRAQVGRGSTPKSRDMSFRPDTYVSTFSDAALRDALDELARPSYPKGGVLVALHATLTKAMPLAPSTIASMVRPLIAEEAARRWARDYDRELRKRRALRKGEIGGKWTLRTGKRVLARGEIKVSGDSPVLKRTRLSDSPVRIVKSKRPKGRRKK